eukprot:3167630-Amphidinium_carterae.1
MTIFNQHLKPTFALIHSSTYHGYRSSIGSSLLVLECAIQIAGFMLVSTRSVAFGCFVGAAHCLSAA